MSSSLKNSGKKSNLCWTTLHPPLQNFSRCVAKQFWLYLVSVEKEIINVYIYLKRNLLDTSALKSLIFCDSAVTFTFFKVE